MKTFKQGSLTVTDYASEFNAFASDLLWNKPALMAAFYAGLSLKIKLLMVGQPDSGCFTEMIALATRCDNALRLVNDNTRPFVPFVNLGPNADGPAAMEIDAMRKRPLPLTNEASHAT